MDSRYTAFLLEMTTFKRLIQTNKSKKSVLQEGNVYITKDYTQSDCKPTRNEENLKGECKISAIDAVSQELASV